MSNAAKNFDILTVNILHNNFDSPKMIFRSVSKFLDTSSKPYFPCDTLNSRRYIYLSMFMQ